MQPRLLEYFQTLPNLKEKHLSFAQTTPFSEKILLEVLLEEQKTAVVSIYPTLYLAMNAFEAMKINQPKYTCLFWGADEFMSAQLLSSSPELLLNRISVLYQLTKADVHNPIWIFTHIAAIVRPIMTPHDFRMHCIKYDVAMTIAREHFIKHLVDLQYQRVSVVEKPGDFAIRGEIIDVFSPQNKQPYRLVFFDEVIENIYYFDLETQLRKDALKTCICIPMTDQLGQRSNLIDYLPSCILAIHQKTRAIATFEHLVLDAQQLISKNEPSSHKEKLYLDLNKILAKGKKVIDFDTIQGEFQIQGQQLFDKRKYQITTILKQLSGFLKDKYTLFLFGDNQKIVPLFHQTFPQFSEEKDNIHFLYGSGFYEVIHQTKEIFLDFSFLLEQYSPQNKKQDTSLTTLSVDDNIKQIEELIKGDYIVHTKHGIGRYDGVETIVASGVQQDFIVLLYQNEEKVYIPVQKIETLYKYVAARDGYVPKLSKIGDKSWKRRTKKIQEQIEAFAQELFHLYLQREKTAGFAFAADTKKQEHFETLFPHEETQDQLSAIKEIKKDMEAPFVMERLLCGDVGFGKTEVAFRAAFKAIDNQKQVVLLAPTTILAKQHYENACKRFEGMGVRIAMLSRLVTKKEQETAIFNLAVGDLDFVIGTHRLLGKDIEFADLGLIIIDEEHRFGVADKEKLKRLKTDVDVLQISATPIPRTLQMAVTGIRDMSLLQTAPHNRYPIQTYVVENNEMIIRDAIEREIAREGQVFYLYNNVKLIESMVAKIQKLVPDARIGYAHGQMTKMQLEKIMTQFVAHEVDVLVSTTIIENGMDIPNANTLLIDAADYLGLAQLYQLRGRVGRSNRIAYCYLMYYENKILTKEAMQRLQTIQSFTALGSGYHIAMRDLAIRGAGDVLGKTQSGFINDVGFDLYLQMLQTAMNHQKDPQQKIIDIFAEQDQTIDIQMLSDAYIPSSYLPDEGLKIEIYQKIEKMQDLQQLQKVEAELINRFGKLPIELERLLYVFLLKQTGRDLNVQFIREVRNKLNVRFTKSFTKKLDQRAVFNILKQQKTAIEVSYVFDCLQLSINTMRVEPVVFLQQTFEAIKAIQEASIENHYLKR